jgi:hypothetical protein
MHTLARTITLIALPFVLERLARATAAALITAAFELHYDSASAEVKRRGK